MQGKTEGKNTFIALTALWAFVESGLGGLMHAFHLPFTGIFLGGFSVLVITLIAHFEKEVFKQVIKATVIVMTIKLSVNPATSPFAYLAVGFQGLSGALIFSVYRRNMFSCTIFAVLAMLESAFQKLLILTLFLGKSWWTAFDIYYNSICKTFGFDAEGSFGLAMVGFYVFIYFIWGFLLGLWSFQLPLQVTHRLGRYKDLKPLVVDNANKKKKTRKKLLILSLIIFLYALSFFLENQKPVYSTFFLLLRTFFIVVIWIQWIAPFLNIQFRKWLNKRKQPETPAVLEFMPYISARAKPLYQQLAAEYQGFRKWKEFVLGLIVISLNADET